MPYPRYDGFVAREPGDRADSPGNKQETVRVAAPRALQVPREVGGQDHARQVVVAERGVTNVTRHEDLVGSFTREHQLPIGQMPGRERRIDPDFVIPIRKRFQLGVRQTESPRGRVVRRAVGNPVGMVRECKAVVTQLVERHGSVHWGAIVQHVQVRAPEVHDPFAARVLHVGIADVPFLRHGPIQHLRATGHFEHGERDVRLQFAERLADPVAGDAAAVRVEIGDQCVHRGADILGHPLRSDRGTHAGDASKSAYVRSRSRRIGSGRGQRIVKAGSSKRIPRPDAAA